VKKLTCGICGKTADAFTEALPAGWVAAICPPGLLACDDCMNALSRRDPEGAPAE
jgi:hypothetical protein